MSVRGWFAILSLLPAVAACRARPSTPETASARIGIAGDGTASPDTAGCGFVPRMVHEHPDELLAEYLRRDGDGEFARSDSWRDEAMACPAHAPGWDGFTLISSYRSTPLGSTTDTARYLVSYTRLGLLEQDSAGFLVRSDSGQERDTVFLVRTAFGWRIGDWDEEPHLLPEGALKLPTLRERDRKALQAMAP